MTELHNQAGALAHLGMLQAVITRLAGNSSSCKTWCLAVVGAMLALAGSTKVPGVALLAVLPGALFALLDSMYLAQERLYRRLFDRQAERIAQGTYGTADRFKMASGQPDVWLVRDAFQSWSVWPIYCGVLVACLLAVLALSVTTSAGHL
jgi:hypothetical protein